MEFQVVHYLIVIYLTMLVIMFWAVFYHLCRPNFYRAIVALLVAIVWPIAVILLIIMWMEAILVAIRDVILENL